MFIFENFLLFSWASSYPPTRPQGASKLTNVNCLSSKVYYSFVGQVPAPRGRPSKKHIFTSTNLPKNERDFHFNRFGLQIGQSEKFLLIFSCFSSWALPRPKTRPLGAAKSVEVDRFYGEFLVVQLGKFRPPTRPQGAAKLIKVNC
jgi:hypothetical protein